MHLVTAHGSVPSVSPLAEMAVDTWEVELGVRRTARRYCDAINGCPFASADDMEQVLGAIKMAQEPTLVHVAFLTATDLGFKVSCSIQQLYAYARSLGLRLSPAELAPALALSWDRLEGLPPLPIVVASNPIRVDNNHELTMSRLLGVHMVGRTRTLYAMAYPGSEMFPRQIRWAFCVPSELVPVRVHP